MSVSPDNAARFKTARDFVRTWNAAQDFQAVRRSYPGVPDNSLRVRASRLRAKGVRVKKFKCGPKPLDVGALNKSIVAPRKGRRK